MAAYASRQSTMTDTAIMYAALFNDEFNQLILAFASSTGHKHDGTSGEGGYVPLLADSDKKNYVEAVTDQIDFYVEVAAAAVKQLSVADGAILPTTDNDIDLGSATFEFKDLYIDGVANIDSLIADTADINGGTFDGVVGGTTPAAGSFTTLSATGALILNLATLTSSGDLAVADGGTGSSTAGAARTALGVAIGSDVQAYDAGLLSIAGLTTLADRMIYTTASDTYAVATLSATGRSLIDDASTSAMRTTLGLAIGTDVQAYNATLLEIAGLAKTNSNFIVGNGSAWVAESGATVRTSLGLGSLAVASTINNGEWSGTDLAVVNGGTGSSTAAGARTNLGVDASGTDNSTDVTLAGTPDYLTIVGQVITRGLIDLTTDVTGDLPVLEGGTGSSTASGARTNLGLVISTDVQAYDANLTTWAGKTVPTGVVIGTTDTQTLSSKTLTSPILNIGVSGTAVLDEDAMGSNSATKIATQQSIKAYVDNGVVGDWVQIETRALSAQTTEDFETGIDSTYDVYRMMFTNIHVGTDGANIQLRVGIGGTPTYIDGAGTYTNNGDTKVDLIASLGAAAGESMSGELLFFAPSDTSTRTLFKPRLSYINISGDPASQTLNTDCFDATTAVTAIRILASTGTLATGDITLYGLKK